MRPELTKKTGFALKVMLLLGLLVLSKFAKDEHQAFTNRNQKPEKDMKLTVRPMSANTNSFLYFQTSQTALPR